MSLLLDALQRASKDKEKAAAQGAPSLAPVVPTVSPIEPSSVELSLAQPPQAPDTFPPLEPAHDVPTEAKVNDPPKSHAWDLPDELTLDLVPAAPEPAPIAPSAPPPEPAEPQQPMSVEPLVVHSPTPVPAVGLPATPLPTPPPSPEPAPSSLDVEAVRASMSSPTPSRVAQDMRRAYMPVSAPAAKRRRTLVYLGLSVAVAVVLAGLGFKMWEDTAFLRGASTMQQPMVAAQIPAPAAQAPLAASEPSAADPSAPMVAAEPKATDGSPANLAGPVPADIEPLQAPKPKAVLLPKAEPAPAPLAPATRAAPVAALPPTPSAPAPLPASNQVQGGGGAKQSFESRIRGPSPLELGYAALVAGRWDEATQHYNQALKANSEERDALLGLAYIAQQKGQRDDAQVLYRRVLRQEPGNAIASSALLALDFEADSAQSASRAKELAMRQPDSAATMSMAGTAAVREGLLADAAQLFARAQYLEPTNPMHAYNHAVALDRLGQHAAAVLQYEQVLKLAEKPAAGRSAFSVDAVRERLTQLRQALASPSKPAK